MRNRFLTLEQDLFRFKANKPLNEEKLAINKSYYQEPTYVDSYSIDTYGGSAVRSLSNQTKKRKYLVKFQEDNGLVPDGIIGKNTLRKMKEVFNISSNIHLAHFLGQVATETAYFKYGIESMNYSADRLQKIFKRYFPTKEKAEAYARNQEKIANYVYMDKYRKTKLGNIHKGDGWKYRGRGAIQITGRNRYQAYANYIGDQSIMDNPGIVATKYYWETALWFFKERNIWKYANNISIDCIKKVSLRVNGGYNGLEHRIKYTKHFYNLTKDL